MPMIMVIRIVAEALLSHLVTALIAMLLA